MSSLIKFVSPSEYFPPMLFSPQYSFPYPVIIFILPKISRFRVPPSETFSSFRLFLFMEVSLLLLNSSPIITYNYPFLLFHSIPCFFFQDNLKDKITSVSILFLARLMFSFPSDSFRWFCLSPIYFQSLYFLLSLNNFLPEYVSRQYMLLSEYLPAGVFRSILFSPSPKCFSCRPVLFLNASLESIFLLHIYFPSNDFPNKNRCNFVAAPL